MQQQISNVSVQPSAPPAPAVKLWTPGFIAWVTLLLGFPAGTVLTAINWMRMKMTDKAVTHLIAGAGGMAIFLVGLILLPGEVGRLFAIVVNIGILFYLRWQMQKDMKIFQAANTSRIEKAGWPGGCLIGLGMLALYFLFGIFLLFVFVMLDVPIPD